MSDAAVAGPFLIGGLVGLVVLIVLTCLLYCCYTKRRDKKKKKPPAKRKRRPPNVISHLHGWVWLSNVVTISYSRRGIVHLFENGQSEQNAQALGESNEENGH